MGRVEAPLTLVRTGRIDSCLMPRLCRMVGGTTVSWAPVSCTQDLLLHLPGLDLLCCILGMGTDSSA